MEVKSFFNTYARERNKWIKRNSYYNKSLIELYKFHIPPGMKILEIGCGTGYLINALNPSTGVGIDFSEEMIKTAGKKYPSIKFLNADAHYYNLDKKFDYIIISDTLGYFYDIQKVMKNIRQNCTDDTRIIINTYSYLWEPILNLLSRLGLKMKQPFTSWLSINDIENLLDLESFEVIKKQKKILVPIKIPLISWIFNKYLANLPLINKLNLVNLIVARPLNIGPIKEGSASIVVPARNEEGNIESLIDRIPNFCKNIELVFIEGGSSDQTWKKIIEMSKKNRKKFNIKYAKQKGKGKGDAVRKGFEIAQGEILMILDADMTVAPEELPKFYNAINSNNGELINGSRLVYPMEKEAMRSLNIFGNKVFSILFSWLLDQNFKDTLCGTKVISKKNYERLKINRNYFGNFDPFGDFDLIFGASKMDLKISEIPIRYKQRIYGNTNIRRFYHGWLLLKMCFFAMGKIKFV